jgi:hypothetical protein
MRIYPVREEIKNLIEPTVDSLKTREKVIVCEAPPHQGLSGD